jgi:hypothetical protein
MVDPGELHELVAYLASTTRLSAAEARHVIEEVLSFLDETAEAFIRRRHLALQAEGLANSEIFARLQSELARWRFRSPAYSERQIRRIIYG